MVTDNVEVPEPVTDAGLKVAVAPDGRPLTLRFTAPAKPPKALMVVV